MTYKENKIICNPLNLMYRYQIREIRKKHHVFREAADPTMILHNDKYLLFCSMSGGFWYSDDMYDWKFHETPELPIYDYAPDVRLINGRIVFSASKIGGKCRFYVSSDPLHEPFAPLEEAFPWWDPHLFQDEDGSVYFYWGCSTKPLKGIRLDPETLKPMGKKKLLIGGNPDKYGWERRGENNVATKPVNFMGFVFNLLMGKGPFIEGAYMTKYNGRYYLQYAAPGTEYNVYSDGVYVGDDPLGPFTYQPHNPFSSVPGGFITGAGHGSTFQDKNGKWWHITTMRISVNENFERRIGLFPCDFDSDGILHCEQELADYPFDVESGTKTDLMLLDGEPSASTFQPGFEPEKGCNEDVRSWWAADDNSDEQWFRLDLGGSKTVCAVQINFADHQMDAPEDLIKRQHKTILGGRTICITHKKIGYILECSENGIDWSILHDTRTNETDYCHDFIVLGEPSKARYLKLSHMTLPFNGVPAISGLRVFGYGNGPKPAQVQAIKGEHIGHLNIQLSWKDAVGATRYNVRYGIAPEKLYSSWQTPNNSLNLSTITTGETYYAAVDSINENGITPGEIVRL